MTLYADMAASMVKLAEEEHRKSFGQLALAGVPVTLASAVADVPKNALDKGIDDVISGRPVTGLAGRGLSHAAGRVAVGLATTPVFLSGIQDMKSQDQNRKMLGAVKVVGSGVGFSIGKGLIADSLSGTQRPFTQRLRSIGTSRGLVGLGSALATAGAISRPKDPNESAVSSWVKPALTGAAIGAIEGGIEGALDGVPPRAVMGRIGGRAVAGAVGTAVLSKVVGHFTKKADADQNRTSAAADMLVTTGLLAPAVASIAAEAAPNFRSMPQAEREALVRKIMDAHPDLDFSHAPHARSAATPGNPWRVSAELTGRGAAPEALAHEVGHATTLAGAMRDPEARAAKLLAQYALPGFRGASTAAYLAPLAALGASYVDEKTDRRAAGDVTTALALAAAAASTPLVAEEALASAKALRILQRQGGTSAAVRSIPHLAAYLSTYGAVPLALLASAALPQVARKASQRQKEP